VLRPIRPGHVGGNPRHLRRHEPGVPSQDPVGLSRGLEPQDAILPDGLQGGVAGHPVHLLHLEKGPVHQEGHLVQHVEGILARVAPHRGGAIQGEPAPEDAEPHEEPTSGLGKQIVAPVDGGAEGPVPGHHPAAAGGEEGEDVVQAVPDLLHRQDPYPGRRQLDGQGDAVQGPADLGHHRRVSRGQREPPGHVPGPILEELEGLGPGHGLRGIGGIGNRESGDEPRPLAHDPQGLPARGQDGEIRTGGQEGLGRLGAGLHQVFAVVQHQEERPPGEEGEGGPRVSRGDLLLHTQGPGDLLSQVRWVRDGRQLDPAGGRPRGPRFPFRPMADQELQGEAGLSAPPCPGEGQEAGGPQEFEEFPDLPLPTHQGGEGDGKWGGSGRGVHHGMEEQAGNPAGGPWSGCIGAAGSDSPNLQWTPPSVSLAAGGEEDHPAHEPAIPADESRQERRQLPPGHHLGGPEAKPLHQPPEPTLDLIPTAGDGSQGPEDPVLPGQGLEHRSRRSIGTPLPQEEDGRTPARTEVPDGPSAHPDLGFHHLHPSGRVRPSPILHSVLPFHGWHARRGRLRCGPAGRHPGLRPRAPGPHEGRALRLRDRPMAARAGSPMPLIAH
jgi:hypothetical protein